MRAQLRRWLFASRISYRSAKIQHELSFNAKRLQDQFTDTQTADML